MRTPLKYHEHTVLSLFQAVVPQYSVMLRIWLTTFRLKTEDANSNKWKETQPETEVVARSLWRVLFTKGEV